MNNVTPLISVITPAWNRANYLERVWTGLNSQSYKKIEWIVGDDGSTDETADLIKKLASRSSFPIALITASMRVGKARMDNECVALARGQFIIECDSDDYLLPNAIEILVNAWKSIPEEHQKSYFGVFAKCSNEQNVKGPCLLVNREFDSIWNDLSGKFDAGGDMVALIEAKEWKMRPFPEVDFVVPESITWAAVGHKKVRFCPNILMIKEYKAPHCISFSGRMEYCRGRAYSLAIVEKYTRKYRKNLQGCWWKLITYIRYCIHGEIGLPHAAKMWGSSSSLSAFILMVPVAYLLALKDQLQGKVRRTHIDFISASRKAIICHELLKPSVPASE